jgi:hypothetical protein
MHKREKNGKLFCRMVCYNAKKQAKKQLKKKEVCIYKGRNRKSCGKLSGKMRGDYYEK